MDPTENFQSSLANNLLQALPHPAMLINQSREIIAANKLAMEAGAVVGQRCWQTFAHSAFLSEEHQKLLLENPEPTGVHCTFCRGDASLENMHKENDPNVNADGSILDTYWIAINKETYLHYAIDVTDQAKTQLAKNKAEEELKRKQKLLTEMSKIWKVGGWEFNIDTGESLWTEEIYRIHEVSLDYGPKIDECINTISKSSKPVVEQALQRAIEHGEQYDLELELITAKGNVRHVRLVGIPDLDQRRIYGFLQDITEKKIFQQSQLRSSQLSILGEVAAGVAHEINNPINGIINYAQLLINRNDENDISNQTLERIIKEGNRISNIVKNLLNFAKKDRNEFSCLELIDIVVEPLNLQSQLFKKDGIHVEVGIPDDLPQIYGNKMQLEQVVLNLLSNARHALNEKFPEPSNEKFIVIDATSSNYQNGGNVQLRIKDSGCGIPKDLMEKIFNPFFTTKEAGIGTGLGMSVSHDILKNHGATISIDSQVDEYTMITITFPVKSE